MIEQLATGPAGAMQDIERLMQETLSHMLNVPALLGTHAALMGMGRPAVARPKALPQPAKPRLGELATDVIRIDWIGGVADLAEPGYEAMESMFEGAYVQYFICPPGTKVEALDTDYLNAATVEAKHDGEDHVVIAAYHF